MLEVLAGRDEEFRDPRQANTPKTLPSYTSALDKEVKGKKIALLAEGFANCDGDVVEKVKHAAGKCFRSVLVLCFLNHSLGRHLEAAGMSSGFGVFARAFGWSCHLEWYRRRRRSGADDARKRRWME